MLSEFSKLARSAGRVIESSFQTTTICIQLDLIAANDTVMNSTHQNNLLSLHEHPINSVLSP